jgi:membrane-bound lytic murein transglycosylase B
LGYFLDVERLDQDRQKGYRETEKMLQDVRKISTEYGIKRQKIQADSLEQAKNLAIHHEMRKSLQEKLQNNLKTDKAHDIFPIEQQVIEKAQAMFDMLKTTLGKEKITRFFLRKQHKSKSLMRFIKMCSD